MNKSHAFAAVSTVYFEMKYSVQSSTDSSQTGDNMSRPRLPRADLVW